MGKIIVGIQGDRGSTNERACHFFAEKYDRDIDIKYLISTKNVLQHIEEETIDYGTFALKSSKGGFVEESKEAFKKYTFTKVDEHNFQLDHALLQNGNIDVSKTIHIYSHPQALKVHRDYIQQTFPYVELIDEVDTAIAAQNLAKKNYPENSLVIAPVGCAELFRTEIYLKNLPSNEGYETTIYLVKK